MTEVVRLLINGEIRDVEVLSRKRSSIRLKIAGREYHVEFSESLPMDEQTNRSGTQNGFVKTPAGKILMDGSKICVAAPIPGVIIEVAVDVGTTVDQGTLLFRLEAMKMQNSIFSPASGTISRIGVQIGAEVSDGEILIEIEPK